MRDAPFEFTDVTVEGELCVAIFLVSTLSGVHFLTHVAV